MQHSFSADWLGTNPSQEQGRYRHDPELPLDSHIQYMYTHFTMIRTQIYIEDRIHQDLRHLAEQERKSMAEVTRDILREGTAKRKTIDTSGRKTLRALTNIGATSDDPNVSENIDHYLYGSPKRKP